MMTRDSDRLRAIAARTATRSAGGFEARGAEMDAAELRNIADALDEAARPRSRREIEGQRKPGWLARLRRAWTRRF